MISLEIVVPALLFLGTFFAVLGVSHLLHSGVGRADKRMDQLVKTLSVSTERDAAGKRLFDDASKVLATPFTPRSEAELGWLKKDLGAAGFQSATAVATYSTVRLLVLMTAAISFSAAGLMFDVSSRYQPLVVLLGLLAGLYVPRFVLLAFIKQRQKRILRALPDALDLLVISIDAGQALDGALKKIVDRLSPYATDLCSEFRTFLGQLNMGVARRDALHQLGARSGVTELNSLAAVLNQADRFGSSIAESLRDLSEAIRLRRRLRAEEKAQQTAVKLIFPLVLFIFPGIFAVLVGPAAISLYRDFVGAP